MNKLLENLLKVTNTSVVSALRDGFVLTMPITLIGSIFLLIANMPFNNYADTMAKTFGSNWNVGLNQVSACTFDILAMVIAVGIGYAYAHNKDTDGISCGMLSLVSFLIVSASSVTTESGEVVGGVIPRGWTGGNGVVAAIIVGILVGIVFTFFMKRNIRIKMPEGVPTGVTNAFSALIPGFVVILVSMIVYQICQATMELSLTEIIFKVLQIPLQNLSDSLLGGIIIAFLMSILFWCGVHGANVVMGVMNPIVMANALSNQAIIDSGKELTVAGGAKIMTIQVVDVFVKFGGIGLTLGLIIAALLAAKSKQMRQISKLSLIPGMFNINEPVIFGLPIAFNPLMLVPFVVAPIVGFIITYGSIAIGFMAPFSAVQVPWTTPPIISAFLVGGVQGVIVQVLIIVASVFIYFPFMKRQDKECLKAEAGEINELSKQEAAATESVTQ